MKCLRCDVELEELDVVEIAGLWKDAQVFSLMMWGGEVRNYSLFECPSCGELSFVREKKQKLAGLEEQRRIKMAKSIVEG